MVEEGPNVFNVFTKELGLMTNEIIFNFTVKAFQALCPDYFWYIPAGVRGHHPPICRTRGGLVHHVKLAVTWADTLLDLLGVDDEDIVYSQTIAGTLLHDMLRRGSVEDELVTWPTHREGNRDHGRYCAGKIAEYANAQPGILKIWAKHVPIINAVELHMGRWTWEVTDAELALLENDVVVRTVHAADYAASRALHQYLAERHLDPTMRYIKK